jgi:hypothetical protein
MLKSNKFSNALELMGWDSRIQYKRPTLSKNPFIGCLSHTAGKQEFLLWWLFNQTVPFLKNSCLVMAGKDNPLFGNQPYKYVLSHINIILLGDKRWKKSQGYVKKIAEEVVKKKYKVLVIAPSGKDQEPREWKSGYYNIGQELGWGFRVVGFDFETHRLKVGPYVETGKSYLETQKVLQVHMGDIVPLYLTNSYVKIKDHNTKNVCLIEKKSILIPLSILISAIAIPIVLRKEAGKSVGDTIFHIMISLYGLYLQTHKDIVINFAGLCIIYEHIPVIYMGLPRASESVIKAGSFMCFIIGLKNNQKEVYIPFLYSFLSKVPTYAKTPRDQAKVIAAVAIISSVIKKVNA